MKKIYVFVWMLLLVGAVWYGWAKVGGLGETHATSDQHVAVYSNTSLGISVRVPIATSTTSTDSYSLDESYVYQLSPQIQISGTKFTIPKSFADGTNLAHDTYISVEKIPDVAECSANLFFDGTHVTSRTVNLVGQVYSIASSTGAGAGNRYEETVYAISGSKPCIAVRYFIHYGVLQNYDPGTVHEFDEEALLLNFDSIRESLKINQ